MQNRDPKLNPGDASCHKSQWQGHRGVVKIHVQFPGEATAVPCQIRLSPPDCSTTSHSALLSLWSRLPYSRSVRRIITTLLFLALGLFAAAAQETNSLPRKTLVSQLIEAAGHVEYLTPASTNWNTATNGLALKPGDKVRTRAASRAAVQLSDRSVIRLSERTTLEILPPRNAEKKRFGLPNGSIYFFNREKPADVEFDTPLAAGAIRGTEFLLEVGETNSATHLALIDGLVGLQTQSGEIALQRGEELRLSPGQPPIKTALINANSLIQWALYYPAVISPDDLHLDATESAALKDVLEKYRAGDLIGALAAWPESSPVTSIGARCLRAQLELAIGRVNEAEKLLADVPNDTATKRALIELISVVIHGANASPQSDIPQTASECLSHSYALQARTDLPGALAAAKHATTLGPQSGFAHARLAELHLSVGNRRAALMELKTTYKLSPRHAPAHALQGFDLLNQGDVRAAMIHFDKARELDAALGPAWLGRGLCLLRERRFDEARSSLQAAVALEPQRGLFRSYLGKAASEVGDAKAAAKEFNLAKQLDANDPTAWLYSALHLWQENRLNEAIRDLEKSSDLNDNRAAFRSRLLLDQDRAVRSANLAALYDDAGIPDASHRAATRAVNESYANFSGHLFLADSFAAQRDGNGFDLRNETSRQSELLVANLLAPPGAGNLSQQLSQQERLRFFDQKPFGVSALSEYRSTGDWRETATIFGSTGGLSYAFDGEYVHQHGQEANDWAERRGFTLTLKQRVTSSDEAYFQIGNFNSNARDVASHYDPAQSKTGFSVRERQEPTLYAGWHHEWSPGNHTLFLFARLEDSLTLHDPNASSIFLRQVGGVTTEVQSPPFGPPVEVDFNSGFKLYSAELQQVLETEKHSLVIGGRWQHGDVDSRSALTRTFPLTSDEISSAVDRANAYAYYTLKICEPLSLVGGVSYDRLEFPINADLPPLTAGRDSRDLLAPKAALLFAPWERGLLRASYTKSLGGLYFDNSVRLEPTQVGGFNQAFRSLIPESVAGLIPGAGFETRGVGFDQSLQAGTYFGLEAEWLSSNGKRDVGVLTNSLFLPIPDFPGSTRQELDFRERNVSAYVGQLLGDHFSIAARYRLSEAELSQRFPDVPDTATGLDLLESDQRAVLHQLSLTANFHHRCGAFAQWESAWYHQSNSGYTPALNSDDFWQHNIMVGYRFPRRHAELRVGLLNIFDTDYRLNPLNLHGDLPRNRTIAVSLRVNF